MFMAFSPTNSGDNKLVRKFSYYASLGTNKHDCGVHSHDGSVEPLIGIVLKLDMVYNARLL